ncbi:transposase [Nonomuraea rosea]|uniref:transposase n=1 Tax=Nonomuraea rosea TaxID=638574 RepID=UPI003CD0AA09
MAQPSKFGDEFKRDAVVRTMSRTCADVARELGMNRETSCTWVRESETTAGRSSGGLAQAECATSWTRRSRVLCVTQP